MEKGLLCALVVVSILVTFPAVADAGEQMVVELKDGSEVRGELLKKDDRTIHLSVGDQVLSLDRTQVDSVRSLAGEEEKATQVEERGLYKVGRRPVQAVPALAEELGPAVVTVRTPAGLGTGWFCSPSGYVITNHHVVAGERTIGVTAFRREEGRFEKQVYKKVKLVALNEHIDLALLKVEEDLDMEIPQLYLGDSTVVKEGDEVFTIGNPMGLERSASQGIISKINRNFEGRLYVQTTAPIAPGNSGGPLFNERGEVIGVTNMGYIFLDGLGFAIPSEYVKEFLDNVDAFAFDPDNPNSGVKYMEVPVASTDDALNFTQADFIKAGHGLSCLTLADVNQDGVEEVVFVNNNEGEIGVLRLRREAEMDELERPEDFEDLNRLPDSERFKLDTHAVNNKISAIAVEDMNDDELLDILFHGDVDGLAVLEQEEDGSFGPPRKIADIELAKRPDALQVADLDGDGTRDILAFGGEELNVFHDGTERSSFPLNVAWRDKLVDFYLRDVNGDGRTDVTAFSGLKFHAARVLLQNEEGGFVREALLPSHVSGPVAEVRDGTGALRFVTLDKGRNRVRRLALLRRDRAPRAGVFGVQAHALPLDAEAGTAGSLELADLDADGYLDALTVSKAGSEFVLLRGGPDGFTAHRSPAPQNVAGLKLWNGPEGRAALFSFSQEDRIFGVSRVEDASVSFPRPINTEGPVEFLWLDELDGREELLWVEKLDKDYVVRATPADALAAEAFSEESGSIDVAPRTLTFGEDEEKLEAALSAKPARLAFADFNGDETADLVIYWSYSGRESLYLGCGEGRYVSTIVDEEFLKEQDTEPLLVADITGDDAGEVLLVQPGFVRVLRVDDKQKLYAERQFNWEHHRVSRLVPYGEDDPRRFLALAEDVAKVVEFDVENSRIRQLATVDLAGLDAGELKVGDLDADGRPDILMMGRNAVQVLRRSDERWEVQSAVVLDAPLDYFTYWNLETADLDGDGPDELMLFDSRKAMLEVHRLQPDGTLKMILRHRLFEVSIHQRREADTVEVPKELVVGDVDANGTPDLVFILQDRVAVYSQAPPEKGEQGEQ